MGPDSLFSVVDIDQHHEEIVDHVVSHLLITVMVNLLIRDVAKFPITSDTQAESSNARHTSGK